MKEIEVKSIPSTFKKGGKQCHQLFVKHSKPMQAAEFIARLSGALGGLLSGCSVYGTGAGVTF